ncbi:hypothetical protein [Methyloraptor flagellatus]|uniref:Uncharacterized protein n=1 Tax=Methyloraptor flagellatus TaxID=3162530 RepID=A0AAU7XD44_9HYPH
MFLPDPDEPYRLFRMPRIREVQQLLLDAATAWTGISDDDSQDERLRPIKKLELRKQPVAGIWGFPTGRWFPTHGMNIEHIIRT